MVALNLKKATDLSKAFVWKFELWRHGDEKDVKREKAVEKLTKMLQASDQPGRKGRPAARTFHRHRLPGHHRAGRHHRARRPEPAGQLGEQPLQPAARLHEAIPAIGEHDTLVLMHNDAVVQGLSEVPFMQDVEHWGALTIGTGLGNARFTNRKQADD